MPWQECFLIHEIGRIDSGIGFRTKKSVQNWREHILQSEKQNSDENSGVQKVQNQNNCGIPRNSEQISQPRWWTGFSIGCHRKNE